MPRRTEGRPPPAAAAAGGGRGGGGGGGDMAARALHRPDDVNAYNRAHEVLQENQLLIERILEKQLAGDPVGIAELHQALQTRLVELSQYCDSADAAKLHK